MALSSIFKKIRLNGKLSKRAALLEMITGKTNAQKEADAKAAAEAEQAAKVLANASAITSNGRTTPVVNNTTGTPATSETVEDGLLEYVGDVRGRASRRKRGAPMANNQGTLGQPTILGV